MHLCPPLLPLLACAPLLGQTDAARAVADLHDDERRLIALQRIGAIGEAAVPALLDELQRRIRAGDTAGEDHVVLAIGRLGAKAASATDALCDRLGSAPREVLQRHLWALGSIGPGTGSARRNAVDRVKGIETPPGPIRQELNIALARIATADIGREELVGMLQTQQLVPACVAAMWLVEHPDADEVVRAVLQQSHALAQQFRARHGENWRRMLEETSRAVVVLAPDSDAATSAWACLLAYHDPTVRLDAAIALRREPGTAIAAVPMLAEALRDPERAIVREATITLGFFADEALLALPPLARLQQASDRELQQLAAASIRRIRANLSPIPAAVAELVLVTKDDVEAAGDRVGALGPRASSHVAALLAFRPEERAADPMELAALRAIDRLDGGGPECMPLLLRLGRSASRELSSRCADVLQAIRDR